MNDFIHWHVHTTYSFLDGYNIPSNAAKKAKELGMSHLAITDHNTLAGIYDFAEACKKNNITPIFGLESYYTWDTNILSLEKKERNKRFHPIKKAKPTLDIFCLLSAWLFLFLLNR